MQERVYSIGEAAQVSGVSIKAIRYYEETGLIPRVQRRANRGLGNGHRVFTDADVGRLCFIRHARALGLGLTAIRELVAIAEEQGCPGTRPEYRKVFARHLESIKERIEGLLQLRSTLESFMDVQTSNAGSECTWETCDCMGSVPAILENERSPRRRTGHQLRTGSDRV